MKRVNFSLLILLMTVLIQPASAQDKASIRLDLTYHQLNNGLPSLRAQIRTRIDRRYQPVENVNVNFYHADTDESTLLGSAESNSDGFATYQLSDDFKALWDTTSTITFYATVTDNPMYDDKDADLDITKGMIDIELIEGDSNEGDPNEVKVVINKFTEEGKVPAEEVQVKLQVKRTFGTLSIGNGFETDEDGELTAEFPDGIPGGEDGILTIVAFVEDDSELGYLRFEKQAPWGTVVKTDDEEFYSRSLWASRDKAPYWLLVFPNLIILGIWGTMVYLILLVFRINRLGKTH